MLQKIIIFGLLFALLSPLVLLSLVIDRHPQVLQARTPDSDDAQKTKALLFRSWEILKQDRRAELTVTPEDLNAAVAFVGRGLPTLAGQFTLEQQTLTGWLTVKIAKTPFGEYLNLSVQILPSSGGLLLKSCQLGQVRIPGALALLVLRKSIDLLTEDQLGSQLLETIEKVSFSADSLLVTFNSGARFGLLKNRLLAHLKKFKTNQDADLELAKLHFYLQLLATQNRIQTRLPRSLAATLAPLFEQARQRSLTASPVAENRAALYALAIYLGGQEFHKLASYLLSPEKPFPRNRQTRFVLADRHDLLQHFLVSVGLKLLSDTEMGFAVGEFKELLDANKGGSGFSFVDLAADRSGLRFAETATRSAQSAAAFQEAIISINEEQSFFPRVSDLEEGLHEDSFTDRYGNVDSQTYQEIVRLIDQRLSELPLYQ